MRDLRILCTIVVFVLLTVLANVFSMIHLLVGIIFFLFSTWIFIQNGIVIIPANPPHKAILVFFGKRQKVVLSEGWNWLPLYPIVFNLILIKVEKETHNFEPQEVRTPDNALLDVKAAITWIPGIDDNPESYITYLTSGGREGVTKILHNIVEDRLKTWARSNKEGPSSWMEAQATKDDAHEVLVKAIMRENLVSVESAVPTSTWMRFFDSPQSEPTAYDANPKNKWAEKDPTTGCWDWNGLQKYFDGLLTQPVTKGDIPLREGEVLPANEGERIKLAIKIRKEMVRGIREGNGKFRITSLGITVVMFVVNEIKVKGAVAEAADKEEKERRETKADQVEIENFSARAAQLQKDHPNLSSAEALADAQVILGKVKKTIVYIDGAQTGLGHDLLGVASIGGLGGSSSNSRGEKDSRENPEKKGGKKGKPDDDFDESNPDAEWEKTFGDKLE